MRTFWDDFSLHSCHTILVEVTSWSNKLGKYVLYECHNSMFEIGPRAVWRLITIQRRFQHRHDGITPIDYGSHPICVWAVEWRQYRNASNFVANIAHGFSPIRTIRWKGQLSSTGTCPGQAMMVLFNPSYSNSFQWLLFLVMLTCRMQTSVGRNY